jgi:two-component system response regulator AlgR
MRVLIVDDEPLARARLAALLGECDEVEIVGSVGDGETALASLGELHPDVLLLDINMPGLSGTALAQRLSGRTRLRDALQRAQRRLADQPREPIAYLHGRMRGEQIRIALNEVISLLAEEKYVVVQHLRGELLIEESLRQLEETYPDQLIRLHRNCLVPPSRLLGVKTLADGRVLARLDGTELSPEISRRNLPAVRKLLRLG